MFQTVNFCGASGQSYQFQRVKTDSETVISMPGIIIFAAADGRVIKLAEQVGRAEDLGAIWRWCEARRYGATQMFVRRHRNAQVRQAEIEDLELGLNPVCESDRPAFEGVMQGYEDVLPLAA